jgi:hypothetical protein
MFSQLLAGSYENRSQVWQVSPTAMFAGGSVGGLILLSLILVAVWKIRVYQRKLRSLFTETMIMLAMKMMLIMTMGMKMMMIMTLSVMLTLKC